jgi:hypothetical protein
MLPTRVLYYGRDEPLSKQIPLRAGPLSLVFENGDLRYIKSGRQEILRRVYVAVRDRNWGTVLPVLSNVRSDVGEESFHITYDVENVGGDIDFFWHGTITGDTQGSITFKMDGLARSTFTRNRIGFCVLHPMRECAGQPCIIETVRGAVDEGAFPYYISPHQPFTDMRAISHQVAPGVWAKVRFEGEIFEMEDQRNWTDASFKTYCTPLSLPFPVTVDAGTRISQSVTLTLTGEVSEDHPAESERRLWFAIDTSSTRPLPRIGLGMASGVKTLTHREVARLRALNLSHLRADINLSDPAYEETLRRAADEAAALGVDLELAIHLSDDAAAELPSLVDLLGDVKPSVCTWLIFHRAERSTSARWVKLARRHLGDLYPLARFGSGTNAFFTELNRERPPVECSDLVTYSLNPQVHAFDNSSLIETLEAQAVTADGARQFCGGLPLSISPITFKMRINPNATAPESAPRPGELPSQVDERQMSLFGAVWTAGSLKYVSQSGVDSVTYYETTGWRGVMETETGSPMPDRFKSIPGAVFPIYHVLAEVAEFAGGDVIHTTSSDPLLLDGLALRKGDRIRVILANMSPEAKQIQVRNVGARVRVRRLDENNAEEAMRSPESFQAEEGELIETASGALDAVLLPYGIMRIDF